MGPRGSCHDLNHNVSADVFAFHLPGPLPLSPANPMEAFKPPPQKCSTTVPKMSSINAAWAKRQPIYLPGFDRATQLGMDFKSIQFGTAWLRKTYTNDRAKSIREAGLPTDDHQIRERPLQEVRYGNNISLLFKACCAFRDFHASGDLWKAVGRVYGVSSEVVRSVVDIFVMAREIYLFNDPPDDPTSGLRSSATYWVDQWIEFINGRLPRKPPPTNDVFAGVDELFKAQEYKNGDLARVLTAEPDAAPPPAPPPRPRALMKRSPSPCPLESSPMAKKRAISTTTDGTGTQAISFDFRGKDKPLNSAFSTNGRQPTDQQPDCKHKEPYFQLKIRGSHKTPLDQDRYHPEADDYAALAQSNIDLQARVESLEKERLESVRAQKDRDNAIRSLQARFTAFERASAAASTPAPPNDGVAREMQDMTEKLEAQAEKLQRIEQELETRDQAEKLRKIEQELGTRDQAEKLHKIEQELGTRDQAEKLHKIEQELGTRDQATHNMQATISSLREELARREGAMEAQRKEFSDTLVRISALEAKNVFFNDLHKAIRELKAKVEAQKDEATAISLDSSNEQDKRDARLKATEQTLKKQDQNVQRTIEKFLVLQGQLLALNSRFESLEKQDRTVQRAMDKVLALEGQSLLLKARVGSLEKQEKTVQSAMDRLLILEDQSLIRNARTESLEKQGQTIQGAMDRLLVLEDQSQIRNARIESLEKQEQTVQGAMDRLLVLEDQSLRYNGRIESLENQTDITEVEARLCARVSTVEQTQADNLRMSDSHIQTLRVGLEQAREEIVNLSKRLATGLGCLPTIEQNMSEMQTKITNIDRQETNISKRLDDLDISREALALQVYAARLDELSKSLETLIQLPATLAKREEARAAASEADLTMKEFYQHLKAASQQQAKQAQQTKKAASASDANSQALQWLTEKVNNMDWVLEKYMSDSREKLGQLVDGAAYARDMGRCAKESSNVATVVGELCRRVGIMERGFEVIRDAGIMCAPRR
ncbi:hypothetical protein KVR01_013849 [Diaporthe batatas]|uniref:uncharacterized protein n=1 Tax=Diaporthe batatas TaxID=748121 RepID=UPI001D0581C5|nr:uncharacterized protein KVR01_013849 [Diaporthe batatas]KAG8156314.1 hypothetical protein KVR01_013849 [Diaporthe batatas]